MRTCEESAVSEAQDGRGRSVASVSIFHEWSAAVNYAPRRSADSELPPTQRARTDYNEDTASAISVFVWLTDLTQTDTSHHYSISSLPMHCDVASLAVWITLVSFICAAVLFSYPGSCSGAWFIRWLLLNFRETGVKAPFLLRPEALYNFRLCLPMLSWKDCLDGFWLKRCIDCAHGEMLLSGRC